MNNRDKGQTILPLLTRKEMERRRKISAFQKYYQNRPDRKIAKGLLTKQKWAEGTFRKEYHVSEKLKKHLSTINKGKILSEKHKQKISESHKGKILDDEHKRKLLEGQRRWLNTPEGREAMMAASKRWVKMYSGPNHPNWKGGISKEPYPQRWTKTLKRAIKERDNYTCRICNKTLDDVLLENPKHCLMVHHIDYNKANLDPINLITLCLRCHTKTNHRRDYWTSFFRAMTTEPVSSEMEVEKP